MDTQGASGQTTGLTSVQAAIALLPAARNRKPAKTLSSGFFCRFILVDTSKRQKEVKSFSAAKSQCALR
jgi:hypothetical protein